MKKKYFLEDEFWETLSKTKIYDQKAKLEKREYTYKCSGAKYSGEWKGGFRHGYGVMKWPDNAVYEGEWNLGRAANLGKFTHIKGEIYDGIWYNDKAQGKGTYIHSNGAHYHGMWK